MALRGRSAEHASSRGNEAAAAPESEDRLKNDDRPLGFVALKSIKQGPPDARAALAQIREIYFKTTKRTIEHDIAHAITLLKSLPDEDERDKAAVYMEGLAQMRIEWAATKAKARKKNRPAG